MQPVLKWQNLLVSKYYKKKNPINTMELFTSARKSVGKCLGQDLVADSIMGYLLTVFNRIQIRFLNLLTPRAASRQRYSEFRVLASILWIKSQKNVLYPKIIILKSTFITILPWALKRIILLQKWNDLNLSSLLFPREKKFFLFFYFIVDEAAICI